MIFGTPPLLISPVTPPSCCPSNKMNLEKDFDGLFDDDEGIKSLGSEKNSKSMYGAAAAPSYTRVTVLGKVRNIKSFEPVEWTFIAIGVISLLTSLGFTVERFIHFHKQFNMSESIYQNICIPNDSTTHCIDPCHHWTCLSDFTFALILIVNLIFAIFYGVDGLIRERGFELLGVLIPIIIILSYLSSNFVYHLINIKHGSEANFSHHELIFRIVRLATSWILGILLAVSTIRVYIKMGKLVFILLKEDTKMKRIYQFSSFLSTLLFFNMQLLFNLVILAFSRDVTFLDKTETIALPILVAYNVALCPVGWYGIWYEHTNMMFVFLITLTPTPVYYIYKIVNVALNYPFYDNHPDDSDSHDEDISHYEYVAIFLFIINGLGLLAVVLIVIFAIKVIKNFGKGLNEKIQPPFSMYMCCKRQ